ncbi:MAG: SHOCT domain-containing protein [Thermomicrobiales bacterium]
MFRRPVRRGRPGLIGTMAQTAVIAGTATAVSGSVANRQQMPAAAHQQAAAADQAALESQQQLAEMQAQVAAMQAQQAAAAVPAAAPAAPAGGTDMIAQLQQLAELKTAGILSDAEFEAAKAKLLAG